MSYSETITPAPVSSWAAPILSERGGEAVLVNAYPLTDTSIHNHVTDPSYFYLVRIPRGASTYAVWVYNTTNQTINVQVIGNVTNNSTYPDYSIGSSYTVDPNYVNMNVLAVDTALTPFVSLSVSASTAPTSGAIYAVVIAE
jgi:hypothetical protein